ncbi:MAG: cyclic nucleotide-binding domain-containing protein [Gammaproteobacteria bacterium]|nr:cyclic nucleotide-binding domain-containing protein [Gammaproteobacteria bacterium]
MKKINKVSQLKLLEFLNRISLFKSLDAREREMVAKIPNLVVLIAKDEVFIRKDHFDSDFYIVLNGEANISVNGQNVAVATPGHFIGEVGFICNEARSATVTAKTDIIAMRITRDLFDLLPIRVRESIKQKIINGLVERVTTQNSKIIDLEERVDVLEHELYPEKFEQKEEYDPDDLQIDESATEQKERDSHILDIKPVE